VSADFSTWPGVNTTWPSYTPNPWSAEAVTTAVADYLRSVTLPGVRAIFDAEPMNWDDSANYYGTGQPWGAALYVLALSEKQGRLYTSNGKPDRTVTHHIDLFGIFKTSSRDSASSVVLQRRIEDEIKDALRNDPTLGGAVVEAAIHKLSVERDPLQGEPGAFEIAFKISFEAMVVSTAQ
jgi:hypothetical protein